MTEDLQTRCYRYALLPPPRQEHAIFEAASHARTYWNALVATQRWAENELRHGRRGQLFKRLLELDSRKSAVGGGSAKAIGKILTTHPNLSKEDALNLRRRQIVKELCEVHLTQSGYKTRRFSARRATRAILSAIASACAGDRLAASRRLVICKVSIMPFRVVANPLALGLANPHNTGSYAAIHYSN